METYSINGEHVIFVRTSRHPKRDSVSITLLKETVLECAEELNKAEKFKQPDYQPAEKTGGVYKFSNMILCPSCNNYGYPSTYTKVKPEGDILDLCTGCANRMRTDGFHIVDQQTMTIRLRRTVKEHKYSTNEIRAKVIAAEKVVKEKEEKRKWQLRACAVGICPKCANKIRDVSSNVSDGIIIWAEYKCNKCDFSIQEHI